jgi:hypothetical protein
MACASGARATELCIIHNSAVRSGQPDCAACSPHSAIPEYNNSHMSDQLRHPGNELPEFVPSNRCPNPGGASGHRRLQSQLFDAAACLQTAVLKEALRPHCLAPREGAMAAFAKSWRGGRSDPGCRCADVCACWCPRLGFGIGPGGRILFLSSSPRPQTPQFAQHDGVGCRDLP